METTKSGLNLMLLSVAVAVLVVGAYAFLFGFLKKINEWYYVLPLGKKRNRLPPGDMGWPFIGNMFSFYRAFNSQDPDSFTNNLAARFGKTGIYKSSLFWSPCVVVFNPEFCRKILTDDERFTYGYPSTLDKLVGKKSLLSATMSEHKRLRSLVSAPITGPEALSMHIGYIEDVVISSLQEWANKNSPIELLNEMKSFSFKVFAKIFMASTDSMSESVTKKYTDLFQGLTAIDINFPGLTFHKALKSRKVLVDNFQAQVDKRRIRKTDEPCTDKGLIDHLLEVKDEDGEKFKDEHIVDLLLGLLLAGHETTAVATMWVIIYLHNHHETLQKAKEEQEEIIKRRPDSQKGLTINEIRQMEYLAKVVDESMRINNIQFAIFRKAKVDVEIDGYIIPKGWKVFVWNRAIHMDSETYSNPKQFLPSRWDDHKPKPGSYIPFGAGCRKCPGADLAKLEMSVLLHHFLLKYK